MTRPAMIVAAQPEAAEAGARVLQRGGNAVDAAIAAALVQGAVDPQMCGIAGFGSCHLYLPSKGVHCCIDFHGKTPLAAHPAMWEDRLEGETRDGFGFILKGRVNDLGYQAITTPGALKAYFEAVTEFGSWGLGRHLRACRGPGARGFHRASACRFLVAAGRNSSAARPTANATPFLLPAGPSSLVTTDV